MFFLASYFAFAPLRETSFNVQAQTVAAVKSEHPGRTVVLPPEKTTPASVPRFETAPTIDGKIDDKIWTTAAVFKDFYQTQPGDNIPPSKPTEVFLGYDSKFLYIAFHAYDEPNKVRATVAKRDDIFNDDYVGVLFDTFNDQRRAYELFFNAFGIQADGIYTEGKEEDFSVDIVMESKGQLTEDGYVVEVAIPFKSLRYEAGEETFSGEYISNESSSDSTMRPIRGCRSLATEPVSLIKPDTSPALKVSAGDHPGNHPEPNVSETGTRVATIPPDVLAADPTLLDFGRFVNEPVKVDAGLNVKYGISSTVILDFALNPDFAQVEADETVVTANQRFPIFFEEKRPFFLEGIDIFQTPLQPVHTRTIIDPDYAAKLTGKVGRTTFGLLAASDNAPGDFRGDERLDPLNFRFLDKNAYSAVLRLKRDVGAESSIGMLATTYNFIEKHNHLGGFDGRFRLDPKTVFSFQALGTNSRRFFFNPETGRNDYRTGNGFGYY